MGQRQKPKMRTQKIGDVDIIEQIETGQCDHAGSLFYRLYTSVGTQNLKHTAQLIKDILALNAWKKWRWVGNDFRFCGQPTWPGFSYCPFHHRICTEGSGANG